jgi:hypothetical protein
MGTAVFGGGVALTLRPSLRAVLWELCLLEHRARFWLRACAVELIVGVAISATIGASTTANPSTDVIDAVAGVVRWQLAGAVAGLAVIAFVVACESRRSAILGPPQCAAGGEDTWSGR